MNWQQPDLAPARLLDFHGSVIAAPTAPANVLDFLEANQFEIPPSRSTSRYHGSNSARNV
jgi:hypothetical protein